MTPLVRRALARALFLLALVPLAGSANAQFGFQPPTGPATAPCPPFSGFPLALNLGQRADGQDGVSSRCGFQRVQDSLNAIAGSRAQPNGIATLDGNGLVPLAQIPANGFLPSTVPSLIISGSGSLGPIETMSVTPPSLPYSATLGALFGDAVNARFFGAICNGTADDTAALARAAASGKRVIFQPGVCTTTTGITMASGTKWNATVPRATEIRATGDIGSQMIGGDGVSDVEVTGFNLNIRKPYYPTTQVTVLYFNPTKPGARINVSNNYVPASTSGGLVVDNTTNVSLNDNEVTDTYRDAIRVHAAKGAWILRNYIHDMPNLGNSFRAIIAGSSTKVVANDNRIENLRKSDGAEANYAFDFGGTVGFTIANAQVEGVQAFVDLEGGSARGVIANSNFKGLITSTDNVDTNSHGIYCINNGCSHIRINGNDISGVFTPIHLEGGFGYTIFGNDFHDFYGTGLWAYNVSGTGIYPNPDSPSGNVNAIVATANQIYLGGLAQAGTYSGINVQAVTGSITGNFVSSYAFAFDILDHDENASVEIAHNLLGDPNGMSTNKFGGAINHRGSKEMFGNGTPNGTVVGVPGDRFVNRLGGAGSTLWVKETGNGNTGWVAK